LQALQSHRNDGLQSFGAEYDAFEGQGAHFRRFNDLPELKNLAFVQGLMVNQDDLHNHPAILVGLLRGMAKAAVWSRAHLEDAVRLHWKTFPLTKPQGQDEAIVLSRAVEVLRRQLNVYTMPFGVASPEKVIAARDALFEFGGLTKKQDPDVYYTNELLNQVNDFDAAEIEALPPH
jgi:NitT/TauT family transport system substrate-binding protein